MIFDKFDEDVLGLFLTICAPDEVVQVVQLDRITQKHTFGYDCSLERTTSRTWRTHHRKKKYSVITIEFLLGYLFSCWPLVNISEQNRNEGEELGREKVKG